MHSSQELNSSMFEIRAGGGRMGLEDLFEGFGEQDRLGVIVDQPCGAVGASALISATVTAFYDIQRAGGPDFFVYPDYYLFHVGRALGDHGMLDVFPSRKEVVVPEQPDAILAAVNDRAITRLVAPPPDGGQRALAEPAFDPIALASARARIATCLTYSPSGRVAGGDVRIASNPVVEGYVDAILDPEAHMTKLRAGDDRDRAYADAIAARAGEVGPGLRRRRRLARRELLENGVPVETYRRVDLEEALAGLATAGTREAVGAS